MVQLYILQSLRMWIQETHINGFRWDSTICIRKGQQYCWEQVRASRPLILHG